MLTAKKTFDAIYKIQRAESCHLPSVLRILRENYYHDEAIFKSLCSNYNISSSEKKKMEEYFDASFTAAFEASPCTIAVHEKSGEVASVLITALSQNPKYGKVMDEYDAIFPRKLTAPPLVKTYIKYLSMMSEEAKLFDMFPDARTMWEIFAGATDKNHRKMGVGTELINGTISLARKTGISVIYSTFSSIHTVKSGEKLGMKCVKEYDLSKYTREDGTPVFKDFKHPNIARLMVLNLDDLD